MNSTASGGKQAKSRRYLLLENTFKQDPVAAVASLSIQGLTQPLVSGVYMVEPDTGFEVRVMRDPSFEGPQVSSVAEPSAWCLAVALCICFHQLLDEDSMMTVRVVTNLVTGIPSITIIGIIIINILSILVCNRILTLRISSILSVVV
ncbi:hypothetical protein STEG23_009293 [Scotinomys teguina]